MDISTCRLPELSPKYNGIPRRYENSRPVIIQDYTHRKIVGIGNEIQKRLLERLEEEKTEAVRIAESNVWEKAEERKEKAIKRVREELALVKQHELDQEHKKQDQRIKEECLQVELAMQKLAIEQVQEERAKGEKHLAETIKLIEEQHVQELERAINKARTEEQRVASDKIMNIMLKHEDEVTALKSKLLAEKNEAIFLLKKAADIERRKAVKQVQEEEQKKAKENMAELQEALEMERDIEIEKVQLCKATIQNLKNEVRKLETQKSRLAQFLTAAWKIYETYINSKSMFDADVSEFLLPPLNIEDIENGLMFAQ